MQSITVSRAGLHAPACAYSATASRRSMRRRGTCAWLVEEPGRYDRLVVAPGIRFLWDRLEGYGERVATLAACLARAGRTDRLARRQLRTMDDGGVFAICVPRD
jgi:hypothetical protein